MKKVRIGGASAALGDSKTAVPQLLDGGNVDYIILDYMAEAAMPIYGIAQSHDSNAGYAKDFTDRIWRNSLLEIKRQGVKIVTNAGAMNPHECRKRMEEIAAEKGVSFNIAIVHGDDLRPRLPELQSRGINEMYLGNSFPDPKQVLSVNAYFGAMPIVEALKKGADIVITGRVVDSSLTLGPLVHEFGWSWDDYDRLCAGSLAGHVIECGAQATGGLFTDWEDVPDWAHIGYPIIECEESGAFTVTKRDNTGGLCTPAVVGEQILYEIDDPQTYRLPDVTCDFSQVKLEQVGENRVRVSGAQGRPPTGLYKVCLIHQDGWRCLSYMPIVGIDAARKAERQGAALLERFDDMLRSHNYAPARASRVDAVGAESTYGEHATNRGTREVVLKVGVEHESAEALDLFVMEFVCPTTSMSVGTVGVFGTPATVGPVHRVYSFTLDRNEVTPLVSLNGSTWEVKAALPVQPKEPSPVQAGASKSPEGASVEVPLIKLAWARSGDKGDTFNVGVIARDARFLPYIRAALSEKAVTEFFQHEFDVSENGFVRRYEIPGFNALNFHVINALGGGQMSSLRLDVLAKGKSQQLLEYPISIPANLIQ